MDNVELILKTHEEPNESIQCLRQDAIQQLKKLGQSLPTASTLINMKTNNVFAEPGT
jgi:predicted transcriptional regulator